MEYTVKPYGHGAWLLEFKAASTPDRAFSKTLCLNILRLAERFKTQGPNWLEIVPAYDSLLLKTEHDFRSEEINAHIKDTMKGFKPLSETQPAKNPIEVPVNYGGKSGPDLERVAKACGLTAEDVIARPRRTDPRLHVPAGSIGLAGWQTGIYGLDSPGGWQIIGRTSLTLFDAANPSPFFLKAGDWVRFVPQNSKSTPKATRQKKVYNV